MLSRAGHPAGGARNVSAAGAGGGPRPGGSADLPAERDILVTGQTGKRIISRAGVGGGHGTVRAAGQQTSG